MNQEVIIRPLQPEDIEAAKGVIVAGCREFFGTEPAAFEDMDTLSQYAPPQGLFLVLTCGNIVVGTGAVRSIDQETCELKRMWFLPSYRGHGFGKQMAEMLLDFARSAGYRRILLDTDPRQLAAQRLYQKLGFKRIDRYNDGPCSIFLEKVLQPGFIQNDASIVQTP
ncbi:MAG: GNAT family N-acetyltransferase [Limisphaerales bacterium]